jgi:tetratricopeptide (TPR) repeat protein
MKYIIKILLLIFLGTPSLYSQSDTIVASIMHKITKLAEEGNTESAIKIIDSLNNTSSYKNDARFHVLKAVLYLTIYENKAPGQKDIFLLSKASDALFKARVLDISNSLDKSIKELLIRVASHYLYQGTYDFNKHKYKQALKEFQAAEHINKQPFINLEDTILYFTIGQTALLLKDTALAKKYLKLSFEHNYASPGMVMDLYDLYSATGQKDSAIMFLEKGLILFPGDANILNELANVYLSQKNYASARPLLEQLANIKPGFDIFFNLAAVCQQNNDLNCADKYYRKALQIKKNDENTLFNLALSLYTQAINRIRNDNRAVNSKEVKSKLKNSKKLIKHYLKIKPDDNDALKILQSIYKLLGKERKASKTGKKIK